MGVGHSHPPHDAPSWQPTARIERSLWIAVATWAVLAIVGVVALWPAGTSDSTSPADQRVNGYVVAVAIEPCTGTAVEDLVECRKLTVQLVGGSDDGEQVILEQGITSTRGKVPEVGDELVLVSTRLADGSTVYNFADYERSSAMWVLVVLFVVTVVALGRWRGLGALAGLAISIA
ncbi:MAG: hypothetical protein ABMA25_22840, partial [Ilumatobacteraceae bacterium]